MIMFQDINNKTVSNTLLVINEEQLRSILKEEVLNALAQVKDKPKKCYTRQQAADILHVSLMTIDKYIKDGLIPSSKVGNRVVIDAENFDLAVEAGRVRRYKHSYGLSNL